MDPAAPSGSPPPVPPPGHPAHARRLREAVTRLFGEEPAIADAVEAMATRVEVSGGQVLFREGDPGDSAFLVISGRLRAVLDGDDGDQVLSDAVRGETIGELGLLTGQPRSATVYAVRDSVVARFGATDFQELLRERPEAALPMMRIMAERLRRVTGRPGTAAPPELSVAILPIGTADAVGFAASLARTIGTRRPAHVVDPRGKRAHETLDALFEDDASDGRVVLSAGEPGWTDWNALLLRHADEVLLVGDANGDPAPGPTDAAVFAPRERGGPRVTLVLRHAAGRAPSGTARWLDPRPALQHLHVRTGDEADMERVARWVTGTSVGLVLGGGGARGWAHIGAVRACEELGVPIDFVGGSSHGAAVGAAVADRRSAREMQDAARPWVRRLRDYTVPVVSVLRGRQIGRSIEDIARPGIDIEDLWLPYFAMTTNLSRAERVVQTRGRVIDAVRASVSLPVVLPPIVRDGELYIDGGLLDNLPVAEMRRRMGMGRILAIDPSPDSAPRPFDPLEPDVSGLRLVIDRLVPFRRRRRVPSIGEMIQRTVMAGTRHLRSQVVAQGSDVVILQPQLGDWGLLAFEHLDEIVEAGYRELRDAIATWWAGQATPPAGDSRSQPETSAVPASAVPVEDDPAPEARQRQ